MRPILLLAAFVTVVLTGALVASLLRNSPPWSEPPGFWPRLTTYLTTHLAETSDRSPFPELRRRHYASVPPDRLYAAVEQAMGKLRWEITDRKAAQRTLRAVVTSSIMRFKDDVTVAVLPDGPQGAVLHVSAQSRVGQGDLAANTRHVLDLYDALDALIPPPQEAYRDRASKAGSL